MSKYSITPWRAHTDLLSVRSQIYGSEPTSQRKAVDRVLAWKLRGNLPHAVESTALLVEAQLHQKLQAQTPEISSFSIRAVYTAAFTRFVTGFCDIGRAKERTLEPSSMLDIAKQIGMPTEFVALRHEATHEEMPGLRRLVEATTQALEWLWGVYWSKLEEPASVEMLEVALADFKVEVMATLREFRKVRRDALTSRATASAQAEDVAAAGAKCTAMCGGASAKVKAMAEVLVEERFMFPSGRELGSSLGGAYLIWDGLLLAMCSGLPEFLHAIVKSLLQSLSASASVDPANDAHKEALATWIGHIVLGREYAAVRGHDNEPLYSMILRWCCLYPGYWTQGVGRTLLDYCDESFREEWSDLLEASVVELDAEPSAEIVPSPDLEGYQAAESANADGEDAVDAIGGWSRAIAPPNVPIGVVAQ